MMLRVTTKTQIRLAAALAISLAIVNSTQASLLVYEPFNYTTGTVSGTGVLLSGQGGALGTTGTWSTTGSNGTVGPTVYVQGTSSHVNSSAGVVNPYVGATANLPTSGGYMGPKGQDGTAVTTDHIRAWIGIDPSVTATFTDGTTTWFSYVAVRAFNANVSAPKLAIGADTLNEDRGFQASGQAIGFGGGTGANAGSNTTKLFGQFWDKNPAGSGTTFFDFDPTGVQTVNSASTTPVSAADSFAFDLFGIEDIMIAKISWHDGSPDVISYAKFSESDTLTEANFNAIAKSSSTWGTQRDLDQSQFDTLSFEGARYFADEVRIGTTFGDAIGAVAAPEPSSALLALFGLSAFIPALIRRHRKSRSVIG